jgi:phosphomannomutase/phosphoglucomutase
VTEQRRLHLAAAHLRPLVPLLALALLALSLWLAWSGFQQSRDAQRDQALQQSRDKVAKGTASALAQQGAHLQQVLATPAVQAALASGDTAAAATQLKHAWPELDSIEFLPATLERAYAAMPDSSFGRIAAAEAALSTGAPAERIVKDDGLHLAVAAPAASGTATVVAYARLPLALATAPMRSGQLAGDTYLALRQGGYTVAERGDVTLADSAEALSTPVPGSQLRVAAGLPEESAGAFGLGALASFIAAGLLLVLAIAAFVMGRRWARGTAGEGEAAADEPTMLEALRQGSPDATPGPAAAMGATPAVAGAAAGAAAPQSAATAAAPLPVDPGIFRAYDIRGVVGKTLDTGIAELIGRAIGSLMQEQGASDIVIGRDGRLSGPDLVAGLAEGLRKAGRNVIDIGMVPTPVVYFATYHLHTGCGVAVTGSHNPPDYNGFKIMVGGTTLSGDAITDLHERIAHDRLHLAENRGTLAQRDISDDYVARIASDVQVDRPLRVVVDAGNGVAGVLGPRVLQAIGAQVVPLYCEIDGNFPNHHPDPSEAKNLVDLIAKVRDEDAELGIAFDGDGDRLGVVTRDGNNIFPDRLLMLFAADVLERNPGAVIVYDVKCSGRLQQHILRNGGSPLMWRTGHSLIKAKMREVEAELAGEMSGHFFFAERWYGFDDGIYAAARLLEIVTQQPGSPSEQLDALPDGVSTPEIKVPAPGDDPHAFVERFRASANFEGARSSTIDGLRVDWSDGWGLVRASNTTPVLVMRFDAESPEALERIQGEFKRQLLALDPGLALPF